MFLIVYGCLALPTTCLLSPAPPERSSCVVCVVPLNSGVPHLEKKVQASGARRRRDISPVLHLVGIVALVILDQATTSPSNNKQHYISLISQKASITGLDHHGNRYQHTSRLLSYGRAYERSSCWIQRASRCQLFPTLHDHHGHHRIVPVWYRSRRLVQSPDRTEFWVQVPRRVHRCHIEGLGRGNSPTWCLAWSIDQRTTR